MKRLPRILLAVLSLLLAVLLTLTTLFSGAVSAVRAHFTPEYIYNFMQSINYAALELPDENGNAAPLYEIINGQVKDFGIAFSESDLNSVIRSFSLDAILMSFVQDLRTWFLDDGTVPILNPREVAELLLSGLDDTMLALLSFMGNPTEILSESLSGILSAADLSEKLSAADGVREIFSEGTLFFVISLSATLFLLILVTRRLRLIPAIVLTGCSCAVAGSVLLFADALLSPFKAGFLSASGLPLSTVDLFWIPFMETVHRTGTFMALGGLAAAIVFGVFGSFAAMIRREKEAAAYAKAQRDAFPAFDPAFPMPYAPENTPVSPQPDAEPMTEQTVERTAQQTVEQTAQQTAQQPAQQTAQTEENNSGTDNPGEY